MAGEVTSAKRDLLRRLGGSSVIALGLPLQRRIPYLPRSALEALRDARVRWMVRYAARYVPYYRDLFARDGIDARDVRTAVDLDRLPLLDRDEVRRHPDRFVAGTPASWDALLFLTSGSTGRPLRCLHDRRSLLANLAYGERERAPVNKICGAGFRPRELYVGYETSTFKKVIAFYQKSALLPVKPRRRFVSLLEPIEQVAKITKQERPDVLVGYGGWIELFFRTVLASGLDVHLPKMVMSMGEALSSDGRVQIEEHFGVPVLSRYNAVESFKIGFSCERRAGLHVHEDLCHLRVVSADGDTARPNEPGQVVISNLVNRATVLLNYPIHDVASLDDRACSCGRTLKLLSELEGRVEDVVLLADGRSIHPRALWAVFKDDREVLQYQVIQQTPTRFSVLLATSDDHAFGRARARAAPRLRRLLGESASVELQRRAGPPWRSGYKFRAVSSRVTIAGHH